MELYGTLTLLEHGIVALQGGIHLHRAHVLVLGIHVQHGVVAAGDLLVLLGEGLGIGHILVHALIGGLVICQNGIHVVDDDGLLVGVPANVIAQGIGHQAEGDIGAAGGCVDVRGHVGGDGGGLTVLRQGDGRGTDDQLHGHAILGGSDGALGIVPLDILESQPVKHSGHGQIGPAVPDLGHRIGKGDILIVDQHIEVSLLGGDGGIRLHGEGGDADGGGHQRRAQGGAKYTLHAKHSF